MVGTFHYNKLNNIIFINSPVEKEERVVKVARPQVEKELHNQNQLELDFNSQ